MPLVALDIGGANLKAADAAGRVVARPFELWKQPDRLAGELERLLACFPDADTLAITMTAELCDCYATKRQGVDAVLDAVTAAAEGRPLRLWQTDGRLVSPDEARKTWLKTAAANWMALARFAGRFWPSGPALLIDVGSTTADLIPLEDGLPRPRGETDPERLASGELVYSGVRRTPLCALVDRLPWNGRNCRVAAEWFATTLDVYLTLGDLPEDDADRHTADGRPATCLAARDRLARTVCADRYLFSQADARAVAEAVRAAQHRQLREALDSIMARLGATPEAVILSGEGEFLARRVIESLVPPPEPISLKDKLTAPVARAACAYALAVIAGELDEAIQELRGRRREPRAEQPAAKTQSAGRPSPRPTLRGGGGDDRPLVERQTKDLTDSRGLPLSAPSTLGCTVVKLGGSTLELPDLASRLEPILKGAGSRAVLLAGGGRAADVVRHWDTVHELGEETAHWLAVRSMSCSAHLAAALLRSPQVVSDLNECVACWRDGALPVLDPLTFLQADDAHPGALPHRWEATSDSIAARVAVVAGATELILVKSCAAPGGASLEELARSGLVDAHFPTASAHLPRVAIVDIRAPLPNAVSLPHGSAT